jgi:tetratricopeptide (TPR) repeat protein
MAGSGSTDQVTSDRRTARVGRGFLPGCLAGCLVSALAAVAASSILYLWSSGSPEDAAADKQPPAAVDGESSPASAKDASRTPAQPAPPPQPAIMLAATAVPATTEGLQQESQGVADQLLVHYPDLPEALHVVALFHAQMRQSSEAEQYWSRCIELAPGNVQYYVNLAAIAMERGDSELAVQTLEKALEAGCSSPDVYHHLAVSLTNLGRCEEAVEAIQQGLQTYPDFPSAHLVLGQAQLKLGRVVEAESALRVAIEQGVRTPGAYFALANACARQGKQEEAAEFRKLFEQLKDSRKLDPQQRFQILSSAEARRMTVSVLCEAALVHSWQKNSLEAERLLHRAVALDPSNVPACRALANLYRDAGMAPEEQLVRRRLIQIEPLHLTNYLDLATTSARLGQTETAEAALKQAIAIRPDAAEAYTTLAQFYLQSGKAVHARWFAQEAVRRQPTPERLTLLGSTCRLVGDEAAARAAFADADRLKTAPAKQESSAANTASPDGP